MEVHGVLAVFSGARSFDSVSSDSLAAWGSPHSPVAHPIRAFRDRSVDRRVLPCALCRAACSNSLFIVDAGNAPHAAVAVPREGNWHWIDAAGRAFQFVDWAGLFHSHDRIRIEFGPGLVPPAPPSCAGDHSFRARDFEARILAHRAPYGAIVGNLVLRNRSSCFCHIASMYD